MFGSGRRLKKRISDDDSICLVRIYAGMYMCVVLLGRIKAYGLLFLPTPKHRNPFAFPIN